MKFVRELDSIRIPEFSAHYVDYEAMKKVLKQDDADIKVVSDFYGLLQLQIEKVHSFSNSQCETIRRSGALLEAATGMTNSAERLNDCRRLVASIERFKSFVQHNSEAVRKIDEKFNKKLNSPFKRLGGQFVPRLLVSDYEIGLWMLEPAKRLEILREGDPTGTNHPPFQFQFWLQELIAGSRRASAKIAGESMSEQWTRGLTQDVTLSVRNTFLEFPLTESPCKRRARSTPPPAPVEDFGDFSEGEESPHRTSTCCPGSAGSSDTEPRCEALLGTSPLTCSTRTPRSATPDECRVDANYAPALPRAACARQGSWDQQTAPASTRRTALQAPLPLRPRDHGRWPQSPTDSYPSALVAGEASPAGRRDAGRGERDGRLACRTPGGNLVASPSSGGARGTSRWWQEVSEVCPLSGFPVNLLPYPPFKLQAGNKRPKDCVHMIDGPFLVLQVLSTWNFTSLGRTLTSSDISSLDTYMKHCKLGPFRLGRALELEAKGTPQARQELKELQERARRRLENVKHIQRVRLSRRDSGRQRAFGSEEPQTPHQADAKSGGQALRLRQASQYHVQSQAPGRGNRPAHSAACFARRH